MIRRSPLIATTAIGLLLFTTSCSSDKAATSTTAAATTTTAPAVTTEAPATTEAAADTTEAPATTGAADTTAAPATSDATAGSTASTDAASTDTATGVSSSSGGNDIDEITAAFQKFFKGFAGDTSVLEDGDTYKQAIANIQSDGKGKDVDVTVKSVEPAEGTPCSDAGVSTPCATVKFDVLFQGTVAIPDNTGYAVIQDGTWKISGITFCSLAALATSDAPGC